MRCPEKVERTFEFNIFRYTNATPSDFHPDLSHTEVEEHPEELEDDYTPLDPAYLPPGKIRNKSGSSLNNFAWKLHTHPFQSHSHFYTDQQLTSIKTCLQWQTLKHVYNDKH